MENHNSENGAWNVERKKINRNAILAVALAAVIIITFFVGYFVRGTVEPDESQEMAALMKILKETWLSEKNTEELSAEFVEKVIKPYDAYAKYYSPQEYKVLLEEDKGRYSGVGIGIYEDNDAGNVKVAKVYLNSPAYKHLEAGDILVAGIKKGETDYTYFKNTAAEFNQDKDESEQITVLSVLNEFFAGFKVGDEIKLKVLRGDTELDFTLTKEDYIVSYVEYRDNGTYYYFATEGGEFKGREPESAADKAAESIPTLNDDTAYIKLYEFEGGAAEQFESALDFMINERHRTKLILDLRDNGGGLIDILMQIASYIVNNDGAANIKILNFEEKNAINHYSTVNRFKGITDISVIANAGTASASECLIGALIDYGNKEKYHGAQFDYDRLVLTPKKDANGEDVYRTYGKGIMQTTYSLPSGGALKLTTAKIYWPITPICVQGVGITSDIHETDANAIVRANEVLH